MPDTRGPARRAPLDTRLPRLVGSDQWTPEARDAVDLARRFYLDGSDRVCDPLWWPKKLHGLKKLGEAVRRAESCWARLTLRSLAIVESHMGARLEDWRYALTVLAWEADVFRCVVKHNAPRPGHPSETPMWDLVSALRIALPDASDAVILTLLRAVTYAAAPSRPRDAPVPGTDVRRFVYNARPHRSWPALKTPRPPPRPPSAIEAPCQALTALALPDALVSQVQACVRERRSDRVSEARGQRLTAGDLNDLRALRVALRDVARGVQWASDDISYKFGDHLCQVLDVDLRQWLFDLSVIRSDASLAIHRAASIPRPLVGRPTKAGRREWLQEVASHCAASGVPVTATRYGLFARIVCAALTDSGDDVPADPYRLLRQVVAQSRALHAQCKKPHDAE